jgi:hypothetical protein
MAFPLFSESAVVEIEEVPGDQVVRVIGSGAEDERRSDSKATIIQ